MNRTTTCCASSLNLLPNLAATINAAVNGLHTVTIAWMKSVFITSTNTDALLSTAHYFLGGYFLNIFLTTL